jgi:hypothetical protein
MNAMRRSLAVGAGILLVLTLGACDGGSNCSENPTGPGCQIQPTPTPTPRVTVLDTGQGTLPALVALMRPLATTETGAFDATVDWTFTSNDIDVFLMRGTCTFTQFVTNQCTVVASATGTTGKQERVRAANQPAGAYTFIVANFGPEDESIAYQVVFTTGASAASASRGPEAGRMDKGAHLLRAYTRLD